MQVHLVDGTYELFRYFYSPNNRDPEFGAVRGVVNSILQLVDDGATHLGVATDQVIESFRNDMWADYKDGSGIDPTLMAQFPIVEEALEAFGFAVWPQVTHEADDGLAAGAALAAADDRVEQVIICTPDKDMAQLVGGKVVQWDRRQDKWFDVDGVREKFGILPESIPDYLGLVGDTADGFPGLPGWGAKSTATVLARYVHIEDIPAAAGQWDVTVRSGAKLAVTLQEHLDEALLFRTLATLQPDAPVSASVDDMEWHGPKDDVADFADTIGAADLVARARHLASR
ncbi:MAG: 5'-3' exonuclease H3TH domain-containing protein [Acidimicrobiales bacterium]|nr:5'-3' exonuclease H3TH domain-containing protein [Acidimicrobiales bacterium]